MLAYALTIFLGAFLLFQVQPLIGKYILPWFGGGPGVWTTCMLFFQVLLLGGYAYAHWLTSRARPRPQVVVHAILLAGSLALLPIIPGPQWKPAASENPTLQILMVLAVCVGLPYLVLSTTGPLLQRWFTQQYPGKSPYRLYALSNAGSLLALVSYPFLFEPKLTRQAQAGLWGWGLGVYCLACAICAWNLWRSTPPAARVALGPPEGTPPTRLQRLLWVLLPACASVLLLAVTNKLCQDVAVIPFLWVAPLSLYLLTFIISFEHERWYQRVPFTWALIVALAALCLALVQGSEWPVWKQVSVYCGALFVCCLVCHGELYRLRPAPARLTSFYLGIAAGGALGGLFVAAVAPLVFTNYYELHWGMFSCAALFVLVCLTEGSSWLPHTDQRPIRASLAPDAGPTPVPSSVEAANPSPAVSRQWPWLACTLPLIVFAGLDWFLSTLGKDSKWLPKGWINIVRIGMWAFAVFMAASWFFRQRSRRFKYWRPLAGAWLLLCLAALGLTLSTLGRKANPDRIYSSRNFYGVLTVYEHNREDAKSRYYLLQHGRITHGIQFTDPEQAKWPTSYYCAGSGVALAFDAMLPANRRIGVVGLGTGSMAAFARPGDIIRFYEINPEVRRLANSPFKYVPDCAGKAEVVLGDARLSMEREPPQNFDLLALDAFSSDSIPVHLLTREAFALYARHMKTNGVIAVHISNHYLDLEPVVANVAREFNYRIAVIDYDEVLEDWWCYSSTWVLLTHDASLLSSPEISGAMAPAKESGTKVPLWTDDFASVFQILR